MLRFASPRCLLGFLLLVAAAAHAQPPSPSLTVSQMVAADLDRRLDALQDLLEAVQGAQDEPLRRRAMEKHWSVMQGYMEQSLQLLIEQSSATGVNEAVACRLVGRPWRSLSFPGQVAPADYLAAMQGQLGRMRQDVRAMQIAQQGAVLEAVMREHVRSNYAFLQRTRGLGWKFEGWMPTDPATRHLQELGSEGAKLTIEFCSVCHSVPHARLYSAAEWDTVMSTMDRHMVLSDSGVPICVLIPTAEQREMIRDYLSRHAR